MTAEVTVGIVSGTLDPGAAIAAVDDPAAGAIASFVGSVRATAAAEGNRGKEVTALEYEVHGPLAERRLQEIADEAAGRWGLAKVVLLHREGACSLGDPTVLVVCSAPHRAEALDACRWMIDEIKASVPIWKKELYSDGSGWVGQGS